MNNLKLIRITTVPVSLKTLLKGQHRFMSEKGFEVVGVSSKGQELQDVQNDENIRVIALEMSRTISPLKDLKSLWNFYRLCMREKPLIVHSHTPKAGIVGMLGAKLAGVPIRLHTVAGLPLMEATGIKRKVLDFVEKLTYSSATKVYPNSKGLYDFILENNYTTKNKLKVIGNGSSNGIDTSLFSPDGITEEAKNTLRTKLNLSADDFVFVFVGRLVGDKGINELVSAFKRISESANQRISESANQRISESANQRISESANQRISKSANQQISESANQRISKLLLVGSFESDLDPLLPETLKEIEANPKIISVGYQKDVRPYFAISDVLVLDRKSTRL